MVKLLIRVEYNLICIIWHSHSRGIRIVLLANLSSNEIKFEYLRSWSRDIILPFVFITTLALVSIYYNVIPS